MGVVDSGLLAGGCGKPEAHDAESLLNLLAKFGTVTLERVKYPRSDCPGRIGAPVQWLCNLILPGRSVDPAGSVRPSMIGEDADMRKAVQECLFVLTAYRNSSCAAADRAKYLASLKPGKVPLPDTLADDLPAKELETYAEA
ncbi:hypothetical protein [Roseivivax sp. CAU 1761]